MARQVGTRRGQTPDATTAEGVLLRADLPPLAKSLLREALRRHKTEARDALARYTAAQAMARDAIKRHAGAAAELERLKEIYAATRTALNEARLDQIRLLSANADLERDLAAATASSAAALPSFRAHPGATHG